MSFWDISRVSILVKDNKTMPHLADGLVKQYISRIRRILVLKPDASVREVGEILGIDKDYANKLLNKIRKERAKRMDLKTVNLVLAEFEDIMSESDKKLWAIVNTENQDTKSVIFALKELRNNNVALFDKMFDAGIFERQLGKLKTEEKMNDEERVVLDKIIENVFRTTNTKKIRGGE